MVIPIHDILFILKYVVIIGLFICILLTPAYLSCVNNSKPYDKMRARCGSWLFGWSFVGWLFALFVSAKK